jgi:hypothetical protein
VLAVLENLKEGEAHASAGRRSRENSPAGRPLVAAAKTGRSFEKGSEALFGGVSAAICRPYAAPPDRPLRFAEIEVPSTSGPPAPNAGSVGLSATSGCIPDSGSVPPAQ